MAINSIVKWDNSSDFLNNFILETRMYDFGSISYDKKISSFSITSTSLSSANISGVNINYRTNSGGSFTQLGSVIIGSGLNVISTLSISPPVVCKQIQFQIKGLSNLESAIDFTDMSVIFRPLRKYGSTSGDKES